MPTAFGLLVLVSSGFCQMCDSTINGPTWCFQNGGSLVEMRHLVEDGKLSSAEAEALVAQARALLPQQPQRV